MFTFRLSEEETKRLQKWLKKHNKKCRFAEPLVECLRECAFIPTQGAIGGRLTYMFTPTSLGSITKVKCACGKKIDLTDFSEW